MSSFGERIYDLRSRNNMSQGALADKLNVSRQTVSKWENNMCLPEAEKLLQLSEIFSVSVDYILKGEAGTQSPPEPVYIYVKDPDSENTAKYNEIIVRKYVGMVFAIIFGILSVVVLLMGGTLLTIIPAAIMLLGIFLSCNIKHPWLTVAWVTYATVPIVFPFFTAINPLAIFIPDTYTDGITLSLILTAILWILLIILILCTVKVKRGYILKPKNKTE